jgi:hypothetical protein
MGQAQDRFQRADQRAAGAALLGVVAGLDLDLGDFQYQSQNSSQMNL